MAEILLGTCGWSYAEWEGILYPQKQAKLKQYSSIFPTTEIDSTFNNDSAVIEFVRGTRPRRAPRRAHTRAASAN